MNSGKEILNEVPVVQAPKLVAPDNAEIEVTVSNKMSISSFIEKLSNNKTYLNIEDYLVDYQQINIINDTMNYDYKYHSNKYWQNPEKVIKWFKELYQFLVE